MTDFVRREYQFPPEKEVPFKEPIPTFSDITYAPAKLSVSPKIKISCLHPSPILTEGLFSFVYTFS